MINNQVYKRRGSIFLEAVVYISLAMILISTSVIIVKTTIDIRKNIEIMSELKSTAIEVEDWIVEELRDSEEMDIFYTSKKDEGEYNKLDVIRYRKYSTYNDRESLKTRRIRLSNTILYISYDGSTYQIGNNVKDFFVRDVVLNDEVVGADLKIIYEKEGLKYIDEFTVKK